MKARYFAVSGEDVIERSKGLEVQNITANTIKVKTHRDTLSMPALLALCQSIKYIFVDDKSLFRPVTFDIDIVDDFFVISWSNIFPQTNYFCQTYYGNPS